MIKCDEFYSLLDKQGLTFFAGVPDSLLKNFCAYLSDGGKDIITANEGNAIAMALGYHLATGKIGVCYMQNSGIGNATNPLLSLVHPQVYSIPMLMIIGWRGEPGFKDEPQHIAQGKLTLDILKALEIEHTVLPANIEDAEDAIGRAVEYMNSNQAPYAIVVRKGTFEKYISKKKISESYGLSREEALKTIVSMLDRKDIIVSTTGKLSRELFELREAGDQSHASDFLTVGGMGHTSSIALGIALQKSSRQVYCFDGDGSVIMHLGALATVGSIAPLNFRHIVFNNGAHDSVGGQPTAGFSIDISKIALACGYKSALRADTNEDVAKKFRDLKEIDGPALLEIRLKKGARTDLGRPTTTPLQNKQEFMKATISDR